MTRRYESTLEMLETSNSIEEPSLLAPSRQMLQLVNTGVACAVSKASRDELGLRRPSCAEGGILPNRRRVNPALVSRPPEGDSPH